MSSPRPLTEVFSENVRVALARRDSRASWLAREAGMTAEVLRKRLHGREAFKLTEVEAICRALRLDPQEMCRE